MLSEVRWHDGQDLRALRDGGWKLVEDQSTGQKVDQDALYDLSVDPRESTDLRAREPARVEALRTEATHRLGRALEWSRCYPLVEPYAPTPGDMQRLQDLGYAGDEVPPPPEAPK